jgi:hypothetical protein
VASVKNASSALRDRGIQRLPRRAIIARTSLKSSPSIRSRKSARLGPESLSLPVIHVLLKRVQRSRRRAVFLEKVFVQIAGEHDMT